MTPLNSVGVAPKSLSSACCAGGTAHEPTKLRSEAFTSTTAGARGSLVQPPGGVARAEVDGARGGVNRR